MAKNRKKKRQRAPSGSAAGEQKLRGAVEARFAEACRQHQQGDLISAERTYLDVVRKAPNFPPAIFHLSLVAQATGRLDQAIEYAERALALEPESPLFVSTLGNLLAEVQRWDAAKSLLERAHAMEPSNPTIRFNLATAQRKTGDFEAAVQTLDALVTGAPEDPDIWIAQGAALLDSGQSDRAIAALDTALRLNPNSAIAHNHLGAVFLDVGRFGEAEASFRKAITLEPGNTKALGNLARVRRFDDPSDPDVALLTAALAKPLSSEARSDLHFALGKIFDDLGDYDTAFSHFSAANDERKAQSDYRTETRREEVRRLKSAFSAEQLPRLALGAPSELPVFVVGMPRSGTSLVEQIIASHSRAEGAGELPYVHALSARLAGQFSESYPECAVKFDEGTLQGAARWYLDRVGKNRALRTSRVVDKMPGNFNHVGLIATLFPNARILNCTRDVMDVCLSIYRHSFVEGHGYACDLTKLGFEHRAYEELMDHWHKVLPGRILDVNYEALVGNPEAEIPRIIEFCGLGWEPQCLRPHETDRRVHTASNWQVRQPIYQSSTEKWRRYETHLGELEAALRAGPVTT